VATPDVRSGLVAEVPNLLRYARTIVPDTQVAEDLVQETLLRALQRADTFRGEAGLATWLHRILHNLAVDRFRADREDATVDVEREVEAKWHDDSYSVVRPARSWRMLWCGCPSSIAPQWCCTMPRV